MRKAWITGASGYIGSRLLRTLLADGMEVTAVVRAGGRPILVPGGRAPDTVVFDGHLPRLLGDVSASRPDVIFHLAAYGNTDHAAADVERMLECNVALGTMLLEALHRTGHGAFVGTGSFWQHWSGTSAYDPTSLYAATKQAFEDILMCYVRVARIPGVILSLFDVYGPNDQRLRLFDLLRNAQQTGVPVKLSPGEQLLDLVHVDDVCAAFRAAMRALETDAGISGRVFAVSSGQRVTLRQAVAVFEEVSGRPVPVVWGGRPYRSREVMTPWEGSPLPGWAPRVSLADGLRSFLNQHSDLVKPMSF